MKVVHLAILLFLFGSCGVDQDKSFNSTETDLKSSDLINTISSSDSHPEKKFPLGRLQVKLIVNRKAWNW